MLEINIHNLGLFRQDFLNNAIELLNTNLVKEFIVENFYFDKNDKTIGYIFPNDMKRDDDNIYHLYMIQKVLNEENVEVIYSWKISILSL
ncbi:hypothetical protein FPHOBKDP_00021 [Listeria phage LPJP1]|nr:hypothetical protein FPHOBKDP_00021 [Listeria phage LPJP1]